MTEHKKVAWGPAMLLAPVPAVMVSCCGLSPGLDAPNIVTVAWAGAICSDPPMVSVALRKSRLSHAQISESRELVVNLVGKPLVRAMDFCGVKSGRDVDKFAACGLTALPVEDLAHAVAIAQAPLSLCCRVTQVLELGVHDLFLCAIQRVLVDEALLDEGGRLHLARAELVAYAHGTYACLDAPLGFFGYSVAAPDVLQRRMAALGIDESNIKTS